MVRVFVCLVMIALLPGCVPNIQKPDPVLNNAVSIRVRINYGLNPHWIDKIFCRKKGGQDKEGFVLENKPNSDCFFAFNVKPGVYVIDYGETVYDPKAINKSTKSIRDANTYIYTFHEDIEKCVPITVEADRFNYCGSILLEQERLPAAEIVGRVLAKQAWTFLLGNATERTNCYLSAYNTSKEDKIEFYEKTKKFWSIDDWIPLIDKELGLLRKTDDSARKTD